MAKYDYQCPLGCVITDERPMRDEFKPTVICPTHITEAEWKPNTFRAVFQPTPGRESGFYALDYGLRATEDLTVRRGEKFRRLLREGDSRVSDPFGEFDREVRSGKRPKYQPKVQEDPLEG